MHLLPECGSGGTRDVTMNCHPFEIVRQAEQRCDMSLRMRRVITLAVEANPQAGHRIFVRR